MYATSEKTLVDAVTELLKEKENFPRFVKRFEKFFCQKRRMGFGISPEFANKAE